MTSLLTKLKKPTRKVSFLEILAAVFVGLPLLAVLVDQIPWVHKILEWRVDAALTYLRLEANPIGNLPSPQPSLIPPTMDLTPNKTQIVAETVTSPLSTTIPTAILPISTPIPDKAQLASPSFSRRDLQDWNNCGPATLALYLRFYSWEGDQYTISDVVKPIRADRNVNPDELEFYVRNFAGWLSADYRLGGDLDLLKHFIAAGYPIMIEEAFLTGDEDYWPNDDHWTGHYLLLTGYDDSRQVFISQDTMKGADQIVNYRDVDKNWQAFNRLYMLVYPSDQVGNIQALLGDDWDPDVNRQHALAIAKQETQSNPTNAFAWFNLGSNLTYFENMLKQLRLMTKPAGLVFPSACCATSSDPSLHISMPAGSMTC